MFTRNQRQSILNKTPSILTITWNRGEYIRKTIEKIISYDADFRWYIWDNGSENEVLDILSDLRDDRIEAKLLNRNNCGQAKPWRWFIQECKGEIAGKIDDDIIVDEVWLTLFSDILSRSDAFGTLGAWVFLEEDWNAELASSKTKKIAGIDIFQNAWVPGGVFLARTEVLRRFTHTDPSRLGVPIDQKGMVRKGLVNGYPLPLILAEHLDDPRSPHCRMNRPGGWDQYAAYTARMRGFKGPEEYARWIEADARNMIAQPIAEQIKPQMRLGERLRRRATRLLRFQS